MKLTTIITDCTNPYVNLAAEELLTMNGGPDEVILYLWQNANTVVIGKNQNPWRECKVEAMEENGAHLARRLSGGGAVYHDLGNLNFTIIAPQDLYSVPKQNQVILQAVEDLGIHAEVTGRNDLTIEGAKFSGHAYYSSHGRCYHHGTLMMDVNFDDLSNYLQVSKAKLKSHGVQSVRSRVTNLSTYRPDINKDMLCHSLIKSFVNVYGGTPDSRPALNPDTDPALAELVKKYSSEEWRYGRRIPFDVELDERRSWGNINAQLSMKGETIQEARLYSDSLDTTVFPELEGLLAGRNYTRSSLEELKDHLPADLNQQQVEIAADILDAICGQME